MSIYTGTKEQKNTLNLVTVFCPNCGCMMVLNENSILQYKGAMLPHFEGVFNCPPCKTHLTIRMVL